MNLDDRRVQILLRNSHGQDLCYVEAYATTMPGIFVSRMLDDPDAWTLTMQCGIRLGGRFRGAEDGIEAAREVQRLIGGIDWTRSLAALRADAEATVAWNQYRAHIEENY